MIVRYFFAKDCIANGEMNIKHCPTKQMLADILLNLYKGQNLESLGHLS